MEVVQDIDASDMDNQLAVVEYVKEIYEFYKFFEVISLNLSMISLSNDLNFGLSSCNKTFIFMQSSCRPQDYMGSQVEINANMRATLMDWLIGVHRKLKLMPEILYLTSYIIDQYLSTEMVLKRELQLVGVTAMFIACKYEEDTRARRVCRCVEAVCQELLISSISECSFFSFGL